MAKKVYLGNEIRPRRKGRAWLIITLIIIITAVGAVVFVPSIQERLVWHTEQLYTRIRYIIKPPEKVVFDPSAITEVVAPKKGDKTGSELTPPAESAIPTLENTPTNIPLPTLTATVSPLPPLVDLKGVRYMDQHGSYNYCAPANLAMLISFWGWEGDRYEVGRYVHPFSKDKNVMPYEMADFIAEKTDLNVVIRVGGDVDTIRRLVAGGFPVLIEKGTFIVDINKVLSWMGHYNVITGYDDSEKSFIVQDSYYQPDMKIPYDTIIEEWRGFNFLYMVAYTPDKYNDLFAIFGQDGDEKANYQRAADKATVEIVALSGIDKFFAWFNRGDNLAELEDYAGAAECYDEAFKIYPDIPEEKRPWRVMWYRTGPYKAYFGVQRYQGVIALATTTLDQMSEPYLEESYYWRARAEWELGDQQAAIKDFRESLKYHPHFGPTIYQSNLLNLGLK